MSDTVVAGFAARSARGEIFNNGCTLVRGRLTAGQGTYKATEASTGYVTKRSGGAPMYQLSMSGGDDSDRFGEKLLCQTSLSAADRAEAMEDAKADAIAAMDKTPNAFGEDIAEVRQSFALVRNPLQSLQALSYQFKKVAMRDMSKFKKANDKIRAFDDVYLSYQFGMRPLWRSVEDGFEVIQSKLNDTEKRKMPVRQTARGFSTLTANLDDGFRRNWSPSIYDDWERKSWSTHTIKAGILYHITNPVEDLRFELGLRNKDIPETVWQILPYSFMVDRVYNVSRAVRGMTNLADPRIHILAAWTTVKDEQVASATWVNQVNPGYTIKVTASPIEYRDFIYARTPWSPSASDTLDSVNIRGLVSDITRIADLAVLIHKNLKLDFLEEHLNLDVRRRVNTHVKR
jgi:hypothetical protein